MVHGATQRRAWTFTTRTAILGVPGWWASCITGTTICCVCQEGTQCDRPAPEKRCRFLPSARTLETSAAPQGRLPDRGAPIPFLVRRESPRAFGVARCLAPHAHAVPAAQLTEKNVQLLFAPAGFTATSDASALDSERSDSFQRVPVRGPDGVPSTDSFACPLHLLR